MPKGSPTSFASKCVLIDFIIALPQHICKPAIGSHHKLDGDRSSGNFRWISTAVRLENIHIFSRQNMRKCHAHHVRRPLCVFLVTFRYPFRPFNAYAKIKRGSALRPGWHRMHFLIKLSACVELSTSSLCVRVCECRYALFFECHALGGTHTADNMRPAY